MCVYIYLCTHTTTSLSIHSSIGGHLGYFHVAYCLYSYLKRMLLQSEVIRNKGGVPIMVQQKRIWLVSMKMQIRSLALFNGLRIQRCCELWYRWQTWLSLALLWLWCRTVATALIRSLAWEPPYTSGMALKDKKKEKKKRKKKKKKEK